MAADPAALTRPMSRHRADPTIRDGKHNGDAIGWAEHGMAAPAPRRKEVVGAIEEHLAGQAPTG